MCVVPVVEDVRVTVVQRLLGPVMVWYGKLLENQVRLETPPVLAPLTDRSAEIAVPGKTAPVSVAFCFKPLLLLVVREVRFIEEAETS